MYYVEFGLLLMSIVFSLGMKFCLCSLVICLVSLVLIVLVVVVLLRICVVILFFWFLLFFVLLGFDSFVMVL